MRTTEIGKYKQLNEIAESGGIVIFGNQEDQAIPTCELRQAFAIEESIYNRSISELSIDDAVEVYKEVIEVLEPSVVLLHLGESDLARFSEKTTIFTDKYRELIQYIKKQAPKCRIAVVSMKNYENDPKIKELNEHLKFIADSEMCEYGDIANRKVWNPKATKDAVSFVYSIGFVHPLKGKRSLYDLVKVLFQQM